MAKKDAAVPAVTIEQLAKTLSLHGVKLFTDRAGLPLNQAQRNLEGRTHYVDDKTLASFVAKIHGVHVLEDGLMLGLIESVQAGPNADSGRVFRPVFFDVFGNVISRPDIDDSYETIKKANAAFWSDAEDIDIIKSTIQGIKDKQTALQSEVDGFNKLLEELE